MTNTFIRLSDIKSDTNLTSRYAVTLFHSLTSLETDYPDFKQWYFDKVIPGILTGERDIVFSHIENRISGILILKNTDVEKKICTLRVSSEFRKIGIGRQLFRRAFEILNSDLPMITVSQCRVAQFKPLLAYYGFSLSDVIKGAYLNSMNEYVYNGRLDTPIRRKVAVGR